MIVILVIVILMIVILVIVISVIVILMIVILVIVVIVAFRTATRPGTFRVELSIDIGASSGKIVALIKDFQRFALYSPRKKLDPAMQRSVIDPVSGPCAVYEWSGNSKAGARCIESWRRHRPFAFSHDHIRKPIANENIIEYTLTPTGNFTRVTRAIYAASPFILKVIQVFVYMDDLIGSDFSGGFASPKRVATQP